MAMGKHEAGQDTASAAHSSAEYAAALDAVADAIETAAKFIPSAGTAGKVADAAKKVAPQLHRLAKRMPDLAPIIDAAVEQAPGAARAAGDAAARAGDAVTEAAGVAARAVAEPVRAGIADMQAERARKEARRAVIGHAGVSLPVSKFQENYEVHVALAAGGTEAASFPGCYVMVTAGKGAWRDVADFKGVYVGAAPDMWAAVAAELAGNGDPDVYADAKYEQGVHILMYPCPTEQLEHLREALIVALDADVSYNAREL